MVKDEIRTVKYSGGTATKKKDIGGGHRFHESTCLAYVLGEMSTYISTGVSLTFPRFLSPVDKNAHPLLLGGERVTHANFDLHFERGRWLRSSTLIPYLEAGVGLSVT